MDEVTVAESAEAPKAEGESAEAPKAKGESAEAPKAKGESAEAPKAKGESAEAPKAEGESAEAPKAKGESAEAPKAKGESAEAPKAEGESAEAPKAKGESAEAPKAEGESAEAPKAEGEPGDRGRPVVVVQATVQSPSNDGTNQPEGQVSGAGGCAGGEPAPHGLPCPEPSVSPWRPGRQRHPRTLAIYVAFFACGLGVSVIGPTIVTMEILLDTTTIHISATFTGAALGYLLGAVVTGLVYDRTNHELFFLVPSFLMAVATAMAPFMPNVYGYVGCLSCQGFFMGFIQTGGQSYILMLWTSHKLRNAAMQGMHAFWSLGAALGPFILIPFLPELHMSDSSTLRDWGQTTISTHWASGSPSHRVASSEPHVTSELIESHSSIENSSHPPIEGLSWLNNLGLDTTSVSDLAAWTDREMADMETEDISEVRFGYVVIATIIIASPVVFMILFCTRRSSCVGKKAASPANDSSGQGDPGEIEVVRKASHDMTSPMERTGSEHPDVEMLEVEPAARPNGTCFRIVLLGMLFLMCFVYLWMETVPGHFIASFVVKGLGWPNQHGGLITSIYWGSHAIGRVIGIGLALCVRPRTLLILDTILVGSGFFLMLFSYLHDLVIWVAACITGLGLSTIFPSIILWASEYIAISGKTSAVFLVACAVGIMSGPLLTGFMFSMYGPMSMVYTGLGACTLHVALFVSAHAFATRQERKQRRRRAKLTKQGVNADDVTQEMQPLKGQGGG